MRVREWTLAKKSAQTPTLTSQGYEVAWGGLMPRRVRAPAFRETFTQYDPEQADRMRLSAERRIPLFDAGTR